MVNQPAPMMIAEDTPRAVELLLAIRAGDVDTIQHLIARYPGLARAHFHARKGRGWRTSLHMVTDWPGYYPNGPATVHLLTQAGADPNDRSLEAGSETPLHWAASSDDAEVAEALIDAGADINVPGGSIGSPIENAVGYGCWHVARLLVARGAIISTPWVAAALGDRARLKELLGSGPTSADLNEVFWHACAGGQLRVAMYLKNMGADITYSPEYARGRPVMDMASAPDTRRQALLEWLRAQGAPGTVSSTPSSGTASPDAEAPQGETPEGETPEGETPGEETPEVEAPEAPEAEVPEAEAPEAPEAEAPDAASSGAASEVESAPASQDAAKPFERGKSRDA
jgi:hypothetical protein